MSALDLQITRITGPLLLCALINFGLHGVLCVQVYTYYVAFPSDRLAFKILVYGVFTVETLQVVLVTVDTFDIFAKHLGDVVSLNHVRLYWFSAPMLTGIVAAIGQLFFAYRLRVLSESWVPVVPVTLMAIVGIIAAMVTGAFSYFGGMMSTIFTHKCYITVALWNATNIACDVMIVICMIYYIRNNLNLPKQCADHPLAITPQIDFQTAYASPHLQAGQTHHRNWYPNSNH